MCESDLLNGVLVHSAANYAVMLANMVSDDSNEPFVELMNARRRPSGLTDTTYVDVTGLSSDDVSTPLDQARLAVLLMQSPLVRSIVIKQVSPCPSPASKTPSRPTSVSTM